LKSDFTINLKDPHYPSKLSQTKKQMSEITTKIVTMYPRSRLKISTRTSKLDVPLLGLCEYINYLQSKD